MGENDGAPPGGPGGPATPGGPLLPENLSMRIVLTSITRAHEDMTSKTSDNAIGDREDDPEHLEIQCDIDTYVAIL